MYRGMEKLDETVTGLCAIFFYLFFFFCSPENISLNPLNLSVLYSVATNLAHQKNDTDVGL